MTRTCTVQPAWSRWRCGRPAVVGALYLDGTLVVSCIEHLYPGAKRIDRVVYQEQLDAELAARVLASMPLERDGAGGRARARVAG